MRITCSGPELDWKGPHFNDTSQVPDDFLDSGQLYDIQAPGGLRHRTDKPPGNKQGRWNHKPPQLEEAKELKPTSSLPSLPWAALSAPSCGTLGMNSSKGGDVRTEGRNL